MKLKFESGKFATPSLEDVRKALLTGLKENYEQINIEVVDCPNLKDWGCPSEGISGNEKIIDVGGEPYMHDTRFIGKIWDYGGVGGRCLFFGYFFGGEYCFRDVYWALSAY